jgi:hypothetical protein
VRLEAKPSSSELSFEAIMRQPFPSYYTWTGGMFSMYAIYLSRFTKKVAFQALIVIFTEQWCHR